MIARVSSRLVREWRERSEFRTEVLGWAATLAFVALSYALRRLLNRREAGGAPR
jgi:hypothetical protein